MPFFFIFFCSTFWSDKESLPTDFCRHFYTLHFFLGKKKKKTKAFSSASLDVCVSIFTRARRLKEEEEEEARTHLSTERERERERGATIIAVVLLLGSALSYFFLEGLRFSSSFRSPPRKVWL